MENKNGNEKFQHKKKAQKEVGFEFKGCVNPVERVKVVLLVNLAIISRLDMPISECCNVDQLYSALVK